jgi:DNA-binding response OmpR family regulator
MPATSGYDFIAAVKADGKLREIPFLFLTSTAVSDAERSRGLALGAAGFLFRPIDPEALLAKVEACLFN